MVVSSSVQWESEVGGHFLIELARSLDKVDSPDFSLLFLN